MIDAEDKKEVQIHCGAMDVPTTGTTLDGLVVDGNGNPIEFARIQLGDNSDAGGGGDPGGEIIAPLGAPVALETFSNLSGEYYLPIDDPLHCGENEITFDGSGASDPAPGGSGEYPTIPHKPVFINCGTQNHFRLLSLPERDLTGAVLIDDTNSNENPDGSQTLFQDVVVDNTNSGVKLTVPSGCSITFPLGENPLLSIAQVDPAMRPVPMPPGLSSTLFVAYQPGRSLIDCPGGTEIFTEFANDDGFSTTDTPILNGVANGVFVNFADCTVEVVGTDGIPNDVNDIVRCGSIPTPFEFAWYHTDIIVTPACPQTLPTARVADAGGNPIGGAWGSISGIASVVSTNLPGDPMHGVLSFSPAPAGPNGLFCFSNPFTLTLIVHGAGGAAVVQRDAVPGGVTDFGDVTFAPVPGDISYIKFIDDLIAGNINLEIRYTLPVLTGPVEGDGGFLNIGVDIDIDKDSLTGRRSSDVDALWNLVTGAALSGNLGVEASIFCQFFEDGENGGGFPPALSVEIVCDLFPYDSTANPSGPPIPLSAEFAENGSIDCSKIIIMIPRVALLDRADSDFNMALISEASAGGFFSPSVFDRVVNSGSMCVDVGIDAPIVDPFFDVFVGEVFGQG